MRENHFRAWSGFMVLVASIAVFMFASGRFQPVTQIDTLDYANFPITSVESALNNKRTYVYPCFLKATTTEAIPYMVVPYVQFALAAVAAVVFLATLLRGGWSAGMALAASMPLMTNSIVLDYSAMITPDSLAQSLAILAVSFWLRQIWLPDRVGSLLMLGLLVFLCYQTKPFYLFMMGFVPVGGVIARWWLYGASSGLVRLGCKLLFCSTIPFLAWCSLRWFLVGHFGLVSFGGYNVVGIAGQMLRREEVEKLSAEIQPLATAILNSRDQRVDWSTRMTYSVYEIQYNPMVWQIAVPAAEKIYDADSRRVNLALAQLSREVIALRPVRYGIWLGHAAKRALTQTVHLSLVNPVSVCSVCLIVLFFGASWLKSRRNLQQPQVFRYVVEYQTIVWLGIGFAICATTLVILVETPLARYCAPAAVFLPSVLSMGVFQSYRSFRSVTTP